MEQSSRGALGLPASDKLVLEQATGGQKVRERNSKKRRDKEESSQVVEELELRIVQGCVLWA